MVLLDAGCEMPAVWEENVLRVFESKMFSGILGCKEKECTDVLETLHNEELLSLNHGA
jgi:hypothetical protein